MTFEEALPIVLKSEGGTSNDPADRGGLTARGISTPLWVACCRRFGWPVVPVTQATEDQVRQVYKTQFWDSCRCGVLSDEWALVLFDMAVNSGARAAVLTAQAYLRLAGWTGTIDGEMGPATIAALKLADAKEFLAARAGFYVAEVMEHPEAGRFLEGWLNRIHALYDGSMSVRE